MRLVQCTYNKNKQTNKHEGSLLKGTNSWLLFAIEFLERSQCNPTKIRPGDHIDVFFSVAIWKLSPIYIKDVIMHSELSWKITCNLIYLKLKADGSQNHISLKKSSKWKERLWYLQLAIMEAVLWFQKMENSTCLEKMPFTLIVQVS